MCHYELGLVLDAGGAEVIRTPQPGEQVSLPCWVSSGRAGRTGTLEAVGGGLSQPSQSQEEGRGCQKDELEEVIPRCLSWAVTAKYHSPGDSKNRRLCSHRSGGWES